MLQLITASSYGDFADDLAEMHRHRFRVFKGRIDWDVATSDGMEKDGFDDLQPTYILQRDREASVCGRVRLLPTHRPDHAARYVSGASAWRRDAVRISSSWLQFVATALDDWPARKPHKEIALTLFGARRVQQDWYDLNEHLRDRICRAIQCGRERRIGGLFAVVNVRARARNPRSDSRGCFVCWVRSHVILLRRALSRRLLCLRSKISHPQHKEEVAQRPRVCPVFGTSSSIQV